MRAFWPTVVVLALAAGPVQAQPEVREAQVHFQKASKLYADGQYQEALDEFQASRKLVDRPSTILNIAKCYRQLNKPAEALAHYKLYLSRFKEGEEAPFRDEVEGRIKELAAEVEKTKPAPQPEPEPKPEPKITGPEPGQVPATPAPKPRKRIWTWVTGGSAIAVAAIALGLGLKAQSDRNDYRDWKTNDTGFINMGYAATAMYCVAGALAITSVVLFFVEGKPPKESRAGSFQPMLGSSWGLGYNRSF
jgi:tetratricopeptide (TPR) repeat protein